MHLLGYFPAQGQPGHAYASLLRWQAEGVSKEFHEDLEAFAQRLSGAIHQSTVVVLIVENQEQLERILTLGHLLDDLALTVILPSYDPALVGRAHLLRPRFITYLDQDPSLLLAVLGNIAQRHWPPASPTAGQNSRPDSARPKGGARAA